MEVVRHLVGKESPNSRKILYKGIKVNGFEYYFAGNGITPGYEAIYDYSWLSSNWKRAYEYVKRYYASPCMAVIDGTDLITSEKIKRDWQVMFTLHFHDFYGNATIPWSNILHLLVTPSSFDYIQSIYNQCPNPTITFEALQTKFILHEKCQDFSKTISLLSK